MQQNRNFEDSKNKSNQQSVMIMILNIAIVICILICVVSLINFGKNYNQVMSLPYSAKSFTNVLSNPSQFSGFARENKSHWKSDNSLDEFYALGDYFDASLLYEANLAVNNEEQSDYWENRKNEASDKIQSLSPYLVEYDKILTGN